jgi:hypothetical protein
MKNVDPNLIAASGNVTIPFELQKTGKRKERIGEEELGKRKRGGEITDNNL